MTRGIDKVERICLAVVRAVDERHSMRLDGDAALALQVHVVEDLVFHVALRDRLGLLQNAVGKRAFAVVNMCNDAEIANFTLFQA